MSQLTVTAYNVRFGDAFLLTVPDLANGKEVTRHILIDLGSVIGGRDDEVIYRQIASDILRRLNGHPVDLYVMTHEHMDHVAGLSYLDRLGLPIPIDYAWLTASSAQGYYDRFPEAKKRLALYESDYKRVRLAATGENQGTQLLLPLLEINNRGSTEACVGYIKNAARTTSYVYRGFEPIAGHNHPFVETKLAIWGPEEDTAVYYGRYKPLTMTAVANATGRPLQTEPPPGVEPSGFAALMEYLASGVGDSMLAIDRAANNTSIVLAVEWRGWRLLFPGDADLKSWAVMGNRGVLQPVHFLKAGHHLSRNGTPREDLLERILPSARPDQRPRYCLVSTWPRNLLASERAVYQGVPDEMTRERIAARVDKIYETALVPPGSYIEAAFPG